MLVLIGVSLIFLYYFILFFKRWKTKKLFVEHVHTILLGIDTSTCLADLIWWNLMVENIIELNDKHKILKKGDIKW